MMFTRTTLILAIALASWLGLSNQNTANAQYPVVYPTVQTVAPAVVGYSARRRGLFGRRVVVRPIVGAVATPAIVGPAVIASPTVTVGYAPVSAYYVSPVRVYRPAPIRPYVSIYAF